jgi:NTE family protein
MKIFFPLILALTVVGCTTAPKVVIPPEVPVPPPVVIAPKIPPRIGLVLGGGAARGFAHVGVIQVLEEAGIRPAMVTGTSAGSLVAAIYASGKTGKQLQQVAESMEEATIADWTLPLFNRGMLRGDALARYVNGQVGSRLIEDLPLPLGIVATDLNTGQSMLFQRGDTGTAVRASSAVPAGPDFRTRVRGWRPGISRAGARCAANGRGAGDRGGHIQPTRWQSGRRNPGRLAADLFHHEQEHQLL